MKTRFRLRFRGTQHYYVSHIHDDVTIGPVGTVLTEYPPGFNSISLFVVEHVTRGYLIQHQGDDTYFQRAPGNPWTTNKWHASRFDTYDEAQRCREAIATLFPGTCPQELTKILELQDA